MAVDVPDQKGRLAILNVHARNKKLAEGVELGEVALRTPGFAGADLANLLNEAAILTGRRSKPVSASFVCVQVALCVCLCVVCMHVCTIYVAVWCAITCR